jgi:hypothetical protein
MHRTFAVCLLGFALTASSAFAADDQEPMVIAPAITAAATSLATRVDLKAPVTFAEPGAPHDRPLALPALYATTAVLQGYDAYSTLSVLKQGGVEANPVMKGITKSPMAFIGLKAGMTTLSIISAERMWKRGNRMGAVATMVASNVFMAYVAASNARVLRQVAR